MSADDPVHESRRRFIRQSFRRLARIGLETVGSIDPVETRAAPGVRTSAGRREGSPESPLWLNQQPGMEYRRLGRTNFMMSRLALGGGGIRHSTLDVVRRAADAGVNFIDTGLNYGESELALSCVMSEIRDRAWICSKTAPIDQAADERCDEDARPEALARVFTDCIDSSLARLSVESVDCYMLQSVEDPDTMRCEELHDAILAAVAQGKVRHVGFSCHRNIDGVVRAALESEKFDFMMLPVHPMNMTSMQGLLDEARMRGVGVIGMMSSILLDAVERDFHPELRELPHDTSNHQLTLLYMQRNASVPAFIMQTTREDHLMENLMTPCYQPGVGGGNEIDAVVYEELWPACSVCGKRGMISEAALERAYEARYRAHFRSGSWCGAGSASVRPGAFLRVCEDCEAAEAAEAERDGPQATA